MARLGNSVNERDVNRARDVPSVASDDRTGESAEEQAVLPREHPVPRISQLGDVNDLRVGLPILGRIEDEIENLLGRHTLDNRASGASDRHEYAPYPGAANLNDNVRSLQCRRG